MKVDVPGCGDTRHHPFKTSALADELPVALLESHPADKRRVRDSRLGTHYASVPKSASHTDALQDHKERKGLPSKNYGIKTSEEYKNP